MYNLLTADWMDVDEPQSVRFVHEVLRRDQRIPRAEEITCGAPPEVARELVTRYHLAASSRIGSARRRDWGNRVRSAV